MQRGDEVETRGEDSHLQSEDTDLRRNRPCRQLDLRFLASATVRKHISVFKSWSPWYLEQPWHTEVPTIIALIAVTMYRELAECQAWCQDRAMCHHSYSSLTREGRDRGSSLEPGAGGSATYQQRDLKWIALSLWALVSLSVHWCWNSTSHGHFKDWLSSCNIVGAD